MVRPALAVVSAGADNPYGHPARSTLDHLTDAGARVFRTDTDGSVEVSFEGDRMSVRTTGARPVAAAATQLPDPRRIGRSGRRCVGLQLRGTIERMTQTPASPATARAPIAYFWGDDDLGSSRAIGRMAEAIGARNGGPVERFEVRGDRNQAAAQIADLHQRVATQSMFGGGSLAVVTNAGALTVRNEDRDALVAVLPLVAPGSGVVFVEASPSGARQPGLKRLVDAVQTAGGEIRAFRAPKAGELAGWIEAEARERGLRLGQGAARAMATRVGGFVTDNDADRRNQTMIVDRELDKLALYRPDGEITADDVEALVAEAVPGSVWAFTDAVGRRDLARASELLDRLAATTPEPVLLAVLHRRIRELVEVADRLASGEKEASLPRSMGIHSFRAEQLAAAGAPLDAARARGSARRPSSTSTRRSRAPPATARQRRSVAWRSRCGSRKTWCPERRSSPAPLRDMIRNSLHVSGTWYRCRRGRRRACGKAAPRPRRASSMPAFLSRSGRSRRQPPRTLEARRWPPCGGR